MKERADREKQEQAAQLALAVDKLKAVGMLDDILTLLRMRKTTNPLTQRRMFDPKQLHHPEELEISGNREMTPQQVIH